MKRLKLAAAVFALFLLSACAVQEPAGDEGGTLPPLPMHTLQPVSVPKPGETASEDPLDYAFTLVETGSGSSFTYPKLLDESKTAINEAIEAAVSKQLKELGAPSHAVCEVEYSGAGFFSVKSSAKLLQKETGAEKEEPFPDSVLPLTFDTASCRQVCIGDLFDPENERWRGLIPDIVTLQAEKQEMTLLCDVMPAADDRLFYLTEDALVILYRPYEIATYSAGWPEFPIPLTQLSGMLAAEGPMAAMAAEQTGAESGTDTQPEKEDTEP